MGLKYLAAILFCGLVSMTLAGDLLAGLGNTDMDGDGFAANKDCNDNKPLIYPGRPEVCDGWDNDCDGQIDEGCLAEKPSPGVPASLPEPEPQDENLQSEPKTDTGNSKPAAQTDNPKAPGKVFVDGRDTSLPTDFQCNGSKCQGQVNPLGGEIAGLFTENTPAAAIDAGPVGGAILTGAEVTAAGGVVTTARQWRDFARLLIPRAERIENVRGPLGTRDAPRILYAPQGLEFTGNADGAGILIVGGEAAFLGTFHFEGLVIVLNEGAAGAARLRLASGTADIFGAVVLLSDEEAEAQIGGNPRIAYSREALNRLFSGPNALTTFPRVVSWRTY